MNGVRTGDRGVDKDGTHKDEYEPGMDLTSPVTILGEGPRGFLSKQLIAKKELDKDSNPMAYEVGVKEVLEFPEGTFKEGFVSHGIGYPLKNDTFGGFFIYTMGGDKACIGLLISLAAKDPDMDPHYMLQKLKMHPYVKDMLGTGKVVKYGAKTVTIGGWSSIPQLHTDGAMIVGDSASFFESSTHQGNPLVHEVWDVGC